MVNNGSSRIILSYLIAAGPGRPDAVVDFSPNLTVIYGASDTGKSYVLQALDYMLGGRNLKSIPEADGYTHLILGIVLPDQSPATLIRSIGGNEFHVFREHVRAWPQGSGEVLRATHGKKSLSSFLLSHLNLNGRLIRKNARNETQELSFRNLTHLCLVDETSMQGDDSPLFSGQKTRQTAESSVFKLLLDGEDDSALPPAEDSNEARKIRSGQAAVLDDLKAELLSTAPLVPDRASVDLQLQSVVDEIAASSDSISELVQDRSRIVARRGALDERDALERLRLSQVRELAGRFDLLRQQYEADLRRLAMIEEAGTLLGFFDVGVCVFCGADVAHQDPPAHTEEEISRFGESVAREREKTVALHSDLLATLEDVRRQEGEIVASIQSTAREIAVVDSELRALEAELLPRKSNLAGLLSRKSELEGLMQLIDQVARIEELKSVIESRATSKVKRQQPVGPAQTSVDEFTSIVSSILNRWQIPAHGQVRFDLSTFDIVVGGRSRSARGKGMRAILHSAFNLALSEYCSRVDRGHPRFLVLDSPLVTYRAPDEDDVKRGEIDNEEVMSGAVADSFYRDVSSIRDRQVVVIENTDPPVDLDADVKLVRFTKSNVVGRYGFFPL